MLPSNLGSPSLHLPAPLLLLVFHLRPGSSRVARKWRAGRPRNRLRSIYTPSLHPLASPTPLHTTVSAAPPIRSPGGALRTRAPLTLRGRRASSLCPPLVRWRSPPSSSTPMSETAAFPGLAGVRRRCGGKVWANPFPRGGSCLAPSLDRRRTYTRAAIHASGALHPTLSLAKVVFFGRVGFLRMLGEPLSP